MIEVMVAIVVLSLGMLGVAQVLLQALKTGQGSYQRVQASILANDMVERMRANRTQAAKGEYDVNCPAPEPVTDDIASQDLSQWCAMLASLLPAGTGRVDVGGQNDTASCPELTDEMALGIGAALPFDVLVRIRWDDRSASGDEIPQCFEYRTRL